MDLFGKVMSLLFNTLSRFVIAFLPRSKCLLISWLQSPFAVQDWGKRGRAPTSQMSLYQRQPGILEGVFQWWCYPCRPTTGKRREWVSLELATLYPHTDASLWVSHISWDHFLTTVQLTDFGHRGICIWYIFPVLYCMQDIDSMTKRWSGISCMGSPEA